MATSKILFNQPWFSYHGIDNKSVKKHIVTSLIKQANLSTLEKYNDATAEIQSILQDCIYNKERFRASGACWSLNTITHCHDVIHRNDDMNLQWRITNDMLHQQTEYSADNLFFFECGNKIKNVSKFLNKYGKSLKTAGASNGQSVAGAIATGIHSSAIEVGSFQDAVVGLQLIVGPEPKDVVYIERASNPALNNNFATTLNARIIRDDDMFNAALVSLGAFGFIHGIVLEAEDIFLLKRYTRLVSATTVASFVQKLNKDSSQKIFHTGTNIDAIEQGMKPYHYKVYINPYNKNEPYLMEIMYKKPYTSNYPNPIPVVENFLYSDLIDIVGALSKKFNKQIPLMMNALKKSIFPTVDEDILGTQAEIFYDAKYQGKAFGIAFGVDHTHFSPALAIMIEVVNNLGPVPGALGIRFVRGTEATLGFTQFPITCIIEMDGMRWSDMGNMISLEALETALYKKLMDNRIPFTLHWGKNKAWGFPNLVDYMYQNKDDTWRALRSKLLGKTMCDIFSNDFLDQTKLSAYIPTQPIIV
jgi:hypothetical protein